MDIFGDLGFRAGGIFFTFGPLLLLSLSVTMDRKNWKILYQHPYIVLLPVFTYFTISKKKILYGGAIESRLVFSKNFTCFNILLTCILSGGCYIWNYVYTDEDVSISITYNFDIFLVAVVLSLVPTILFMHMPSWSDDCGGFGYCNIHNDVHMYDAVTGVAR